MKNLKNQCLTLLLAALFVAIPLTVSAQTPDGETPAEETVCDGLRDNSPGLYGLCVAMCEAQDMDQSNPDNVFAALTSAPNFKLLKKYRNRMKPGDPDLPCLPITCPIAEKTTGEGLTLIGFDPASDTIM